LEETIAFLIRARRNVSVHARNVMVKRTPKASLGPIERMSRAARAIRALYDPVLHEPIPQRLRALVRRIGSRHADGEDPPPRTDPTRRRKGD
jgi:hypothetical protein